MLFRSYILQNSFYAYRNTFCVIRRRRVSTHSFDEIIGYQRLEELQSILENSEIRTSIAEEGQRNYAKYTSSKDASKLFIDHLKSILNSV